MVMFLFTLQLRLYPGSKGLSPLRLNFMFTLGLDVSVGKHKVELKFLSGQPAITRLVWLFTAIHKSSHYFAT